MNIRVTWWYGAGVVGVICFALFVFFVSGGQASRIVATKLVEPILDVISPDQIRLGLPVRIRIPKINVNAVVEYVGLTPDNAMDVPKEPANVAWLDLGPRPGEKGSAVISGHYGWKNGIPAVFDDLHLLQKGDIISIEDTQGMTTTFVVRNTQIYDQYGDASSIFGSNDGKAHLNLITCEGVWDSVKKSYSGRLVVFTDKE